MGNKFKIFVLGIFILISFNLVNALPLNNTIPIILQVVNSSDNPQPGTYTFSFIISDDDTCSNVVYSKVFAGHNTSSSRAIANFLLDEVYINFTQQYYLCEYRDAILQNVTQIGKIPNAYYADQAGTLLNQSNLDLTNFNITADTGFFNLAWSYLTNLPLFIYNIMTGENNANNLLISNGTAIGYNETVFNNSVINLTIAYNDTAWVLSNGYITNNSNSYFSTLAVARTSVSNGFVVDVDGNVRINGNLTILGVLNNVSVNNLIINGSLIPDQDAVFDLGNSSNRYRNASFSDSITVGRDVIINGVSVASLLYNHTFYANQTIYNTYNGVWSSTFNTTYASYNDTSIYGAYYNVTNSYNKTETYNRSEISNANIFTGAIAIFHFEENSSVLVDSSNFNNSGTTSSGMRQTQGRFGNSFDFNTTTTMSIPIRKSINFTQGDQFTFAFWIKWGTVCPANSTTTAGIFGVNFRYALDMNTNCNGIRFGIRNHTGSTPVIVTTGGNIAPRNNTWVHVVAVYNLTSLGLYYDGILNSSVQVTGQNLSTSATSAYSIGANSAYISGVTARLFNGTIDDLIIWNRALAPSEVRNLYDQRGQFNNIDIAEGGNITTTKGSWFKGLFNWVVGNSSTNYSSFNGSTFDLTTNVTQWLYNQTYNGSTFNSTYSQKADYNFSTNNFNGSGNFTTTGNIFANWFVGLFNWIVSTTDGSSKYLSFNGSTQSFNETALNGTIDNRITIANISGTNSGINDTKTATYIVSNVASEGQFTSIQSAINALPSSGGIIHIKNGTYTLTAPINISRQHTWIEGEGGGTTIQFDGSTVRQAFGLNSTTQTAHITLKNFKITSTTEGTGIAVNTSLMTISYFEDLWIDAVNVGFMLYGSGTHYNHYTNNRVRVNGTNSYGIFINQTANDNSFDNFRILPGNNSIGVYVNAHANTFKDIDVESNGMYGIIVDSLGHDTLIEKYYCEANQRGLEIRSGAEATTIIGGIIIDNTVFNVNDTGKGTLWLNTRIQYEPIGIQTNFNISASDITINGTKLCLADGTNCIGAGNSSYNATYDLWSHNQSYNGTTYNATYALWAYNQSDGSYNVTYATWAYNQTAAAITYVDSKNFINSTNVAFTNQSNTFNGNQTFNGNITVSTGFFTYLGSLVSRITNIFATNIDVSNNLTATGNITLDNDAVITRSNTNTSLGINQNGTLVIHFG